MNYSLEKFLKTDKSLDLLVSNLNVTFSESPVLNNLHLDLPTGTSLAILGAGGSGKSTLLKSILGIIPASCGEVEIFGKKLHLLENHERRTLLRQVSMAFQMGALFDFMTVFDNISFALENMTSFGLKEREDIIVSYLQRVNLPHAAHKLPSELSGGMRRRVGICRALATRPKLALFDEPTAGLDPVTSQIVIELIKELGSELGSSLICVTSNIAVAKAFSNQIALLNEGRIVASGKWETLIQHDDPWVRNFLTSRGRN